MRNAGTFFKKKSVGVCISDMRSCVESHFAIRVSGHSRGRMRLLEHR